MGQNKLSEAIKGGSPGTVWQIITDSVAFKYIPLGDKNQAESQLKYRFRILNNN